MKNCDEMELLISDMIDGECDKSEAARAREHMEACDECRAFYTAMRTVSGELAGDLMTPPEGFASGVMSKISNETPKRKGKIIMFKRFAAAAVACLVISVGISTLPDFIMDHMPRMGFSAQDAGMQMSENTAADSGALYVEAEGFSVNGVARAESSDVQGAMPEGNIEYLPEPSTQRDDDIAAGHNSEAALYVFPGVAVYDRASEFVIFESEKISELMQLLSPGRASEKPETAADFIINDATGAEILLWLTQGGVICAMGNEVYFALGTAEEILQIIK